MTLQVKEDFINETKGYIFGEGNWYEPYTENRGRLFRDMQREYGRCVSRIYVDTIDGPPKTTGWVFQSRQEYEDSHDTYIREVWVNVREWSTLHEFLRTRDSLRRRFPDRDRHSRNSFALGWLQQELVETGDRFRVIEIRRKRKY